MLVLNDNCDELFVVPCFILKVDQQFTLCSPYIEDQCVIFCLPPVSLRWCVIVDIFFMAAVLFISWTSVTHRAWQWPSVQVDVSCVGYGLLHFSCFYLGDFFIYFLNHGGGILRMLPRIIYSI